MRLQIEVSDRDSAIVVTLSGNTDVGALEPLKAALVAAASEGRAVVVVLDGLAEVNTASLKDLIEGTGTAATHIRLVTARPELRLQILRAGVDPIEVHSSVAAATGRHRSPPETCHMVLENEEPATDAGSGLGQPGHCDLGAKYANLQAQYREAIARCRELLQTVEGNDAIGV
jgi:anti-anti-sigma regulatory factor